MSAFRRIRAAFVNAILWGAGWALVVAVLIVIASIVAPGPVPPGPAEIREAIGMCIRIGLLAGVGSAAFSAFISWYYRGRRLSEINLLEFSLRGAVIVGLAVPTFISVMRFLSGDGLLDVTKLFGGAAIGAMIGGPAAAVTLKVAQLAERYGPRDAHTEPGVIGAAPMREARQEHRERVE